MSENRQYDVIIIGGGPAGLTAGLYTARARLKSLLIERGLPGGQIANTELVENYPGFPDGISGYELSQRMHQQATKYGLETMMIQAIGIELRPGAKVVQTTAGDFSAKVVIIATGSERRKLSVPGEEEYIGRGVSYCATCDGALFRDQAVAVAGGGNAAITEALHLAKFATKVSVIHRRDQLRASRILQERAFAEPKIEFLWNTVVEEIAGQDTVQSLKLRNVLTTAKSTLEVAGIFVATGFNPDTTYLKGMLPLDPAGHIITNDQMETPIPGIFAVGDIRHSSARQAITAAGDGATAAIFAEQFLSEQAQPPI